MDVRETVKFFVTFLLAMLFFFIFMFSINNLSSEIKIPPKTQEPNKTQDQYNNAAYGLTFLPNQNYATITTTLSAKFHDKTITPLPETIGGLPSDVQIYAIQQSILTAKIDTLINKVDGIADSLSKQPVKQDLGAIFLNFLAWLALLVSAWLTTKFLDWLWKKFIG